MHKIQNFENLFGHLAATSAPESGALTRRSRIAVVCPYDDHTVEAVEQAMAKGFADAVLVGDPDRIECFGRLSELYPGRVAVVAASDADNAARTAVEIVRRGEADVLMKGLINTDNYLRAILDKQNGLLPKGNVLTHITVSEIPGRSKLLLYSDVAVIPYPTLEQRKAQIGYVVGLCRMLGTAAPRVALLHCTEKISPKFPVTADYVAIMDMAAKGEFGDAVIDGPMDVKTALDPHSGALKGIDSPIGGDADALIFSDIQAGNVFYKTVTMFGHALNAGILAGTVAPVVLPSRADSTSAKLCSIALACAAARDRRG